jgi:acyl-ACP thioesterase
MSKIWSETYRMHTYELDKRQKVSVRAICSYLIDTAGLHVQQLGYSIPQLLEQDRSWFFSRFLLRMDRFPLWRETITVETWPPGNQKLLALRDWRLFSGQQLIGLATSGWLMIDIRSRRPLRPESYPDWKRFLSPERTIPHTFRSLAQLDQQREPSEEQDFKVRFDDVDINGHANYLSYIGWVLASVPPALREERDLAEMEVHFLREADFAEDVVSRSMVVGDAKVHPITRGPSRPSVGTEFLHGIFRKRDGTEVVRARTIWRPAAS